MIFYGLSVGLFRYYPKREKRVKKQTNKKVLQDRHKKNGLLCTVGDICIGYRVCAVRNF